MNKSDMIDVFACSIEKTIGGMWKHEVGIWGASGRHLNFACDGKEYVLVLTEVTDGHNFSEYLGSDCGEAPATNKEKLLRMIDGFSNARLVDLVADRLCVEDFKGPCPECDNLCRSCFLRWLNEAEERDR